jgi:hypothetical protein
LPDCFAIARDRHTPRHATREVVAWSVLSKPRHSDISAGGTGVFYGEPSSASLGYSRARQRHVSIEASVRRVKRIR